jgi:hypothetical protein
MKPAEQFRDHMTVITELWPARRPCDDGVGVALGQIPKTIAENVKSGITIDQLIANKIGQDSPLPPWNWRPRTSPAGLAAATRRTAAPT